MLIKVLILALIIWLWLGNSLSKAQTRINLNFPDSPVIFFENGREQLEQEINKFENRDQFESPKLTLEDSVITPDFCESPNIDCIEVEDLENSD